MQPLNRLPSPWLVRWALLLGSIGWAWVLGADGAQTLPALCSALPLAVLRGAGLAPELALAALPGFIFAWLAMLAAMMPPLLLAPAALIWQRSLPRRRWRGIASFACGYFLLWTIAGVPLLAAAAALQLAAGGPATALAGGLAVALFWQASPWRQRAFNRCHRQPRLAAFGWRAARDALRYGCAHALACIGTCWALMLLPLLADAAHLPLMLACGLMLAVERGLPAQPARWQWPFASLLAAFAQRRHVPPPLRPAMRAS